MMQCSSISVVAPFWMRQQHRRTDEPLLALIVLEWNCLSECMCVYTCTAFCRWTMSVVLFTHFVFPPVCCSLQQQLMEVQARILCSQCNQGLLVVWYNRIEIQGV